VTACPTIDHPLIAVRDLSATVDLYRRLGFHIAPPGQHPWGTATALALFDRQIIEIVSIGDVALLDGHAAGGFRFGRHVERYLNRAEGIALTALCSDDAEATEAALGARGLRCAGTVSFGRDVIGTDGQPDRTRTTLKIFPNAAMPRLSIFACQQHRRDLLEFPDRMHHPNGAKGIAALSIVAQPSDLPGVRDWLGALHGMVGEDGPGGTFTLDTGRGLWRVLPTGAFSQFFGPNAPMPDMGDGPAIAGIDVAVDDLAPVERMIGAAGLAPAVGSGACTVAGTRDLGGIALRFVVSS
jgi:hypothetical protein